MSETQPPADVVFVTAKTKHGNVERMSAALADGFAELGFRTADFFVGETAGTGDVEATLRAHPGAALVSMNIHFPYLNHHAALFADRPVFLYSLDPPVYFLDAVAFLVRLPNCHLGLNSRSYAGVVDAFLPGTRHHFMPHGAAPRDPLPWEARDVPVFFCGNRAVDAEEKRASWAEHGAPFEALLNQMADAQLAAPAGDLFGVVRALMPEPFATDARRIIGCMFLVDEYVRARFRDDLLGALTDVDVHVYGGGWENLAAGAGRMRVHGPLEAQAVQEVMSRAKVVLNAFPPCYDSHERLFDGMAAGAAIAAPAGAFLRDAFGRDAIIGIENAADAATQVGAALADDARTRAAAEATHRRFLDGHTWTHRARSVAGILGISPGGGEVTP